MPSPARKSPAAPSSAGSKQPAAAPSNRSSSFNSKKRRGDGSGRGGGGGKKREQALVETVNNEIVARQNAVQEYFSEIAQLQLRYEAEGKRAKDSYIAILERRLAQAHAATRLRVDAMEEKFQSILSSLSRLLVETYQLGAVGITEGLVLSDVTPASVASLATVATIDASGRPSPVPSTGGRSEKNAPAHIASPFSTSSALPSASTTPRPAGSTLHNPASPPLLTDNEEKIRRFFLNPLSPETTKLEVIDVKELCARVDELRDGMTGLVSQCVTKLSTSIYRVKNLEHALDDQSLCLASAERLLQNSIVKSDNTNQSAIELCRRLGVEVQEKWSALSARLVSALDQLIRDSIDTCLDQRAYQHEQEKIRCEETLRERAFGAAAPGGGGGSTPRNHHGHGVVGRTGAPRPPTVGFVKEMVVSEFVNELEHIRIFQSDILRMVREKILDFQQRMMEDNVLEHAKLFRSNIPEEHRRVLHCCESSFDRNALLQILDRVSFEPAAAEIIIAVTAAFVEANGGIDVVSEHLMTLPGDESASTATIDRDHMDGEHCAEGGEQPATAVSVNGKRCAATGALAPRAPSGLSVNTDVRRPASPSASPTHCSPRHDEAKRKLLYAQALNAVAFPSGHKNYSSSLEEDEINENLATLSPRSHSGGRDRLHRQRLADDHHQITFKNDGVLAHGLGLTTAVQRLKSGLGKTSSQQKSVLKHVPVSVILDPSSTADVFPHRVHTLVNHPNVVGVVAQAHRMFVPSVMRGYVSSVVKERMELEKTMRGVIEERQNELDILKGGANGKLLHEQSKEDPAHVIRLLPSMTPGMKRRVLLDVLADDAPPQTSNTTTSPASFVPHRPASSSAAPSSLVSSGEETTQAIVTSRLSARFSSASLKRDAQTQQQHRQQLETSALLQKPKVKELEALGIRRHHATGQEQQQSGNTSAAPRAMPAAARLYSEKQRSLLRQLLECNGESPGASTQALQ